MKKHLKILSIDDNSDYQETTARYFALTGQHMIYSAGTGRAGLEKAAEVKPDVILLDLQLPDMSGTDVIGELYINDATRSIPVIIITASKLGPSEHTKLKLNKNLMALEEKPISLKDLLTRIENTLLPKTELRAQTENA